MNINIHLIHFSCKAIIPIYHIFAINKSYIRNLELSRLSFFMLGAVRRSGADRVQMEHHNMENLDKMEFNTPICGGSLSLSPIYMGVLNTAH